MTPVIAVFTGGRYAADMTRLHTSLVLLSLSSTLTLACGGNSASNTGAPAPANTSAPAAPAVATPAVADGRKVDISADDTMKFSTVEITATPGERLSVSFTNKGATPKFSMGHNWILLNPKVDLDAFLAAAAASSATEYVPADKKADILASTKLLGPGETDTATFNAPTTPGRYPFVCSFAGHAQLGMKGVLIVK
jgi:azurin